MAVQGGERAADFIFYFGTWEFRLRSRKRTVDSVEGRRGIWGLRVAILYVTSIVN